MTDNRPYNHYLIFALILIVGLGLALALPWLANSQGLAAQIEVGAQGSSMNLHVRGKGFSASPTEYAKLALDSEHHPEVFIRYYVAKTGDGSAPTLGWSTAFTNVQEALTVAVDPSEIWVAKGVYYPDVGSGQIDNAVASTFVMKDGVVLYGGFDISDSDITDRDWESNLTVLSGDIDGNDTNTDGVVLTTTHIAGNNAYHVVTADGSTGTPITDSTVLDGFTITAGQANSLGDMDIVNKRGGGFDCFGAGSGNECSPILRNLSFSGNYARKDGGAMYNGGYSGGSSSPSLSNVTFYGNYADRDGGAMYNSASNGTSSPSLTNVTFYGNYADRDGGAMNNYGYNGVNNPSLINVAFFDNHARNHGGAMYNNGSDSGNSSPSLTNVIFSGNSADFDGGGIYNYGYKGISSPSLTNVAFSGNSTVFRGGAMYNDGSASGDASPILSNVTFSGNFAGEIGGGMYNYGYNGNSKPVVRNSILWNNQDSSGTEPLFANIYNNAAIVTVTHSLVQGTGGSSGWTSDTSFIDGGSNIDIDPMFITPVDPSTAPTTTGNLRLQTGSSAIDAGDNTFVTGVLTDLDGEARIIDGNLDGTPTVDMGAYETQIYVTQIYVGYLPLIFR